MPTSEKKADNSLEKCTKDLNRKLLQMCNCWCCSVTQSCPTLRNPMDCSTPGFPVLHHLPELAQTHVHWVGDANQQSCPLLSSSPPAFNPFPASGSFLMSQFLHQVAKGLELWPKNWPKNQPFQWIFRIDFLSLEVLGYTTLELTFKVYRGREA